MPQRIAALTLVVPDYDEAIAYFCGVLGFELVFEDAFGHRWDLLEPA